MTRVSFYVPQMFRSKPSLYSICEGQVQQVLTGARCSGTYLYLKCVKQWHQYNKRQRALAMLNLPQGSSP